MFKLPKTAPSLICHSFSVLFILFIGLTALAPSAHAQDEAPIRLVFLNTDPSDGMGVYNSVKEVLELSKDLDLIDPDDLLSAGTKHGVKLETFRSGDKRKEAVGAFSRMLAGANAETVIALDVFGGGRTMQLVVIGPAGQQLADIRQRIGGSVPTQDESVTALKKAFKALVPRIREYREEQAKLEAASPDVGLVGLDEPNEDDTIKARVIAEHRAKHANLTRGLNPQVGAIFGARNFALETEANYDVSHSSPFVGVGVQLDAVLALFDAETSAVGASAFAAYAPFTTVFAGPNGPEEKSSSFTDLRLDVYYMKGLSSDFIVKGGVGLEYMGVSIEPNAIYSGNDYFNLRAGLGVIYQFGELAEMHLNAAALPILNADVSDGKMGDSSVSFGGDVALRLDVTAFGPVRASLGYQFKYYQGSFESPRLAQLRGESVSTNDNFHVGHVLLGYDF